MSFSRVAILFLATIFANAAQGQSVLFESVGDHHDRLGASTALMSDFDRDGKPDIAIGASQCCSGAGYVSFHFGGAFQGSYRLSGDEIADGFGAAISLFPDFDGDGFEDMLIGVPQSNLSKPGYVRVVSGRHFHTLVTIENPGAGGFFGAHLGMLGDLDGDGVEEFYVSDDTHESNRGGVWVFDSRTLATKFVMVGDEMSRVRDVIPLDYDRNGDGVQDIAAAAPAGDFTRGLVYIVDGNNGSILERLRGQRAEVRFGTSMVSVIDQNGDGIRDFLVGDGEGSTARIFSGRDSGLLRTLRGEHPDDHFGNSAASGGDFDGDGVEDYAIGARHDNYVWAYSGRTGRALRRWELPDNGIHARSFRPSRLIPDRDGDGFGELVLVDPTDWRFAGNGGWVQILTGDDLFLQANATEASEGDRVRFDVRNAAPRAPIAIYFSVSGSGNLHPFYITEADGRGELALEVSIPQGIPADLILDFDAFAIRGGKVIDATTLSIHFEPS